MEYNVENLFDTLHCEGHADEEFTPTGSHHWTPALYWSKLTRLSRVIAAVGGDSPVDLVALVEVENDSVLANLTQRPRLWRLGYEYIVTHSADSRGVNVALLYQPLRFRPVCKDTLRVFPDETDQRITRDVLHVAGEITTGDTLDVLVCHFPSKRGGGAAQRYREKVARSLRVFYDSIAAARLHPQIVVTGDFNAYYPEPLFKDGLRIELPFAKTEARRGKKKSQVCDNPPSLSPSAPYLLSYQLHGRRDVSGTYKFQGQWDQLDHFIVSGSLLSPFWQDALRTSPDSCRIVDFDFLLEEDSDGLGVHPYRCFRGNYYHGGFSDHLPLLLTFRY